MPHDNVCLLRNMRLALVAAVLFVGSGVIDLLRLTNAIVPIVRHDPLQPFLLVGAALLGVSALRFFTCPVERMILALMMVGVLFKLVVVTKPQLFTGIDHYQRVTAAVISFSCAAICGFAALRGLRAIAPE